MRGYKGLVMKHRFEGTASQKKYFRNNNSINVFTRRRKKRKKLNVFEIVKGGKKKELPNRKEKKIQYSSSLKE